MAEEQAQQKAPQQTANGTEKAGSWRGDMPVGDQGFTVKCIDDAWFAARMVVAGGFNGKSNNTVAKCFIAIQ